MRRIDILPTRQLLANTGNGENVEWAVSARKMLNWPQCHINQHTSGQVGDHANDGQAHPTWALAPRHSMRLLDCGYRWSHYPVPADLGPERKTGPGTSQSGSVGDLKKAQAERDTVDQAAFAARQEMEGVRRTYLQDSPLICRRIGATVLLDFILNFQDRSPILPALAE
ncbi:hypothetical protein LIER_34024 [Lithospermum erythrorhizon]|uniref:Uncharacterized protein n=1 Tax=Lithospermum erythrorhizon TaxID=34254 RepID=A0AAV3S319_LITER